MLTEKEVRSLSPDEFISFLLSIKYYRVDEERAEVFRNGRRLHQFPDRDGYKLVTLSGPYGTQKTVPVHRVVAVSHYGLEVCRGKEIHHKDERRTDHSAYNIIPLSDLDHKRAHGTTNH